MPVKLVTKNDVKIFAFIAFIALVMWYWIDQNNKAQDPFYSCEIGPWELKLSEDGTQIDLILDDGRNFTVPIEHELYAGSSSCSTATYLFTFQDEQYALSNIGCIPPEAYVEGSIGYVYRGQWKGGDNSEFDWTGSWAEPPSIVEECF